MRLKRKNTDFSRKNAMIQKRCGNCGSNEIKINWKYQFHICAKCGYGGTICYAVNPKEKKIEY